MASSSAASSTRAWVLWLGYVALVYALLPVSRDVLITLDQHELIGAFITAAYCGAAILVVYHIVFDVRLTDRVAFAAVVVLGLTFGGLVLGMSIPEERLHFLQYGLMAILARRALAPRFGPRRAYVWALVAVGLIGWGDEAIQGFLPDRVYDPIDVGINLLGALLTLAGYEALHNELGWRATTPPAQRPSP
ncbi:MAG: VanZ family protein [Myxococcota bacterium]